MANAFVYTTVPGKMSGLFGKIREIGVPQKASADWLREIGYRSSNDRGMLTVLKFIGFIESTGAPTALWRNYRGADYRKGLAAGIREGYQDLFNTYPDAHQQSDEVLAHFFSARTDAGKQVVDKTVATFKALTEGADFDSPTELLSTSKAGPSVADLRGPSADHEVVAKSSVSNLSNGLVININIQLTLPESTNGEVYRQFFTAMRESLLTGEHASD